MLRSAATALLLIHPTLPVFCLLVVLRSIFTIPTDPSTNVLVKVLVPAADVGRYFGVLGVLRNLAKIIAPALGAAVASFQGEATSIYLSIAMSLIAVALFAAIGWGTDRSRSSTSEARTEAPHQAQSHELAVLRRTLIATVIVWRSLREVQREPLLRARLLMVSGVWQKEASGNLIAGHLEDLTPLLGRLATESRDFH